MPSASIIEENRSPKMEGFPTLTGGLVGYLTTTSSMPEPTCADLDLHHGDFRTWIYAL